ncbi:MAG: hypothetical protein EXR79_07460 [Myxococcales bacterium]|nr:hypothetical protein [Myxococcales bacterium]
MTEPTTPHLTLLGATGRLGRALQRTTTQACVGLSRRVPLAAGLHRHVRGDCCDPVALAAALHGAGAVVHLCAFDAAAAESANAAAHALGLAGVPLVFASALAERGQAAWQEPEDADLAADPGDAYGCGKHAARVAFERGWPGPVLSVRLPQLAAWDDPTCRESTYIDSVRATGTAWLPGSGEQRPAVVPTDTAAALMLAWLAAHPQESARVAAAHPAPRPLRVLVEALLVGAGLPPHTAPHPDCQWRGPHSSSDEAVASGAALRWLPAPQWPDLVVWHRGLGERLVAPGR